MGVAVTHILQAEMAFGEHETRVIKVLDRLKEFGLKLSIEKCTFFQMSLRYLGRAVSKNGIETDPEKIEAL